MKYTIQYLLIFCTGLLFFSCDKVENPIENPNASETPTGPVRKIVIEEFTGQLCTYCPDGAREIDRLVTVYGEQIIPISVHAGAFAEPSNGAPNDFTTTAGDDYFNQFGPQGFPAAMISRLNNGAVLGKAQWEPEILTIKDLAPSASILITTNFDSISRQVSIDVETEWLADVGSGSYNLQVVVIENHITAYQLDNGTPNNNYDHKHVLRGAVNTSWGTSIPVTTVGTKDTQSFNYTIDATWNESNCEIVAFIYNTSTYEIIQGEIAEVIQ